MIATNAMEKVNMEGTGRVHPRAADHRTPFVRQEWYVAALSDEVTDTPLSRQVLGTNILMYRTSSGHAVALRDRCPHRSFPLSRGRRVGDDIVCGYHGLRFASDGRCVEVPAQQTAPSGICVQTYPLVERAPFLWVWLGDPSRSDQSAIPDHHWLSDPGFAAFQGYMHCRSNYVRLHENVLDLTHFPYVHGEALGGLDYIQAPAQIVSEDNQVRISRTLRGQPVNEAYGRMIGNLTHRVDRTSESWFISPAFHIAHATIRDLDGGVNGKDVFNFKIIHCFTPQTPHATHYFYAAARDVQIDNEAVTQAAAAATRSTFLEDEAALELVESRWLTEAEDFREISVRGDRASMLMRQIIARRAAQENAA